MLLAGNYRCVQPEQMIPIREAVHSDLEASETVYNWVVDLTVSLGGNRDDLVPFEKYANAALSLQKPSSAARALAADAPYIERVDKLVVIVVNAATHPATDRDAKSDVPGLIDTIGAAATVPLDNYSFDTVELLESTMAGFNRDARLLEGCNRLSAAKGPQCALGLPAPHRVEF